ncbi:MAG TPA: PH domain-containing protein [Opitutaceae bacterium]|nr:PH domain-containing protein [Opitutaceae bacterium]
MATVNQEFESAPMGRRVVATMVFILAIISSAVAVNFVFAFKALQTHATQMGRTLVVLTPLAGLLIALPLFFIRRSRAARFRIEENYLVLGRKRFPLEGMVEIARDPDVLRWAFRIRGEGGLGAIQGRYWSKRVGKFDAFMTDTEKAVVLRWPDRVVAVSPADTAFFIMCARSAAGLK